MLVAILAVAGSACGGGDEPTSQSGKLTTVQFAQVLGVAQDVGFTQGEIEKLASEMNKVQESGGWTQQKVEKLVDDIRAAKTTAGAVSQPVSSQATTTTKQTVAPTKAATSVPTTQPAATSTPKPAPTRAAPPPPPAVPTAPPPPDTVNGLNYRDCPDTCSFSNEAAKGAYIRLEDGRECFGNEAVPCYVSQGSGTLGGGRVNPYKDEINGKKWKAEFAYPAPTPTPPPACTTIGCGKRVEINAPTTITVSAAFKGAYIKLPNGRECIKGSGPDCFVDDANGAVVAGGVLYPFKEEYIAPENRGAFK